jgi:orotidine 5'-phosphate decarboxylase subfamily 2
MTFINKLNKIITKNNSLICIGLDTDINRIPKHLLRKNDPIFTFNKQVIDETHDLVCAYKPNMAFYEAYGIEGLNSLKKTIDYLKTKYPHIPTICDAKRADIGSSSEKYAKSIFEYFGFDSITVNPYMGTDSLQPFLEYKDKGIIILCRTSNPGSNDFQDLKIKNEKLYIKVAKQIIKWHKDYKNCLMVIGATFPYEVNKIRKLTDNIFFLVPGMGIQGGDIEKTVKYGLNSKNSGLIISVSRAIIYANKVRLEATRYKNLVNKYKNG